MYNDNNNKNIAKEHKKHKIKDIGGEGEGDEERSY